MAKQACDREADTDETADLKEENKAKLPPYEKLLSPILKPNFKLPPVKLLAATKLLPIPI